MRNKITSRLNTLKKDVKCVAAYFVVVTCNELNIIRSILTLFSQMVTNNPPVVLRFCIFFVEGEVCQTAGSAAQLPEN